MGWGTQWRGHYCLGEALYTVPSHSVLSTEACQRIPLNPHCFCKEKGMLFTEHSASPNLTVVNKMGAKERSIYGFEPASSCQSQCPVWAMQRIKVPAWSQENAVTHWSPLQLAETGKLLNKLARNCPTYCIIQTLKPRLQSSLLTPVTRNFSIYFSISSLKEHFLAIRYAQHCEKCF